MNTPTAPNTGDTEVLEEGLHVEDSEQPEIEERMETAVAGSSEGGNCHGGN